MASAGSSIDNNIFVALSSPEHRPVTPDNTSANNNKCLSASDRAKGTTPTPERKLYQDLALECNSIRMEPKTESVPVQEESESAASAPKKPRKSAGKRGDEYWEKWFRMARNAAEKGDGGQFPITCGYKKKLHALIHGARFGSGNRGKSVEYPVNSGKFMTPSEFETISGCKNTRKYTHSLKFELEPIKELINNQFLISHSASCKCRRCSDGEHNEKVKYHISNPEKAPQVQVEASPPPQPPIQNFVPAPTLHGQDPPPDDPSPTTNPRITTEDQLISLDKFRYGGTRPLAILDKPQHVVSVPVQQSSVANQRSPEIPVANQQSPPTNQRPPAIPVANERPTMLANQRTPNILANRCPPQMQPANQRPPPLTPPTLLSANQQLSSGGWANESRPSCLTPMATPPRAAGGVSVETGQVSRGKKKCVRVTNQQPEHTVHHVTEERATGQSAASAVSPDVIGVLNNERRRQALSVTRSVVSRPVAVVPQNRVFGRKTTALQKLGVKFEANELTVQEVPPQESAVAASLCRNANYKRTVDNSELKSDSLILQPADVSCRDLAEFGLSQCRECSQQNHANCRFAEFRVIKVCRFNRAGLRLLCAGFRSVPPSASLDLSVWLPPSTSQMEKDTGGYIIQNLNTRIDQMIQNERKLLNMLEINFTESSLRRPAFRASERVRELCDICHTSIFNLHLFCPNCGFAVCTDCVLDRNKNRGRQDKETAGRDSFGWFLCTLPYPEDDPILHVPQKMCLGQLIPDQLRVLHTLEAVAREQHALIRDEKIATDCVCDQHEDGAKCFCAKDDKSTPQAVVDYLCDGLVLLLRDDSNGNILPFQKHWHKSRPVIIAGCHGKLTTEQWTPEYFKEEIPATENLEKVVYDCVTNKPVGFSQSNPRGVTLHDFWRGFLDFKERPIGENSKSMCLKLKDYPAHKTFKDALPGHYREYCRALPLPQYSAPEAGENGRGSYNLVTLLPERYVRPDLGPKMYNAYGMIWNPTQSSTNLHLDISDAVNIMVNVTLPKINGLDQPEYFKSALEKLLETEGFKKDTPDYNRVMENWEQAGAIWTIFEPEHNEDIRQFVTWLRTATPQERVTQAGELVQIPEYLEKELSSCDDPIHDQRIFLTGPMRRLLKDQKGVVGATFVQMLGDAVFIPAGAAHQVQNCLNCIKVAEDFVSPEGVKNSAVITSEFRELTVKHQNKEDKLQLVNIVYHSILKAIAAFGR